MKNCCKTQIGGLAVVALVLLRFAVGYHFFKEGLSHYQDSKWTSEGFLKGAKGPLAEWYQSPLPSFHDWNKLILVAEQRPSAEQLAADRKMLDLAKSDPKALEAKRLEQQPYYKWYQQAKQDWLALKLKTSQRFRFTDKQEADASKLLDKYADSLNATLADYAADMRAYRHELWRTEQMKKGPGADKIPFEKARIEARERDVSSEKGTYELSYKSKPAEWLEAAKSEEQKYLIALVALASGDQVKDQAAEEPTALQKQDKFITYALLAIGACLMLGFLTPVAALGGALFLLSVIGAQPPWMAISKETQTYYQAVEMCALLFLAASCAGKYAGLDFFLARLWSGCCSQKG